MPMLNTHVLHPTLPASDLARARTFWGETLECEIVEERVDGFLVEAGGARFLVYPSQFAGTNEATAAAFAVEDVELEVKRLRSRGVEFMDYDLPDFTTVDGIISTPDGHRGAWFTDSEGNIIGLSDFPM